MYPPPDNVYQQGDPGFLQQAMPIDGALIAAWLEALEAAEAAERSDRCGGGGAAVADTNAFQHALGRLPGAARKLLEQLQYVGMTRMHRLALQ